MPRGVRAVTMKSIGMCVCVWGGGGGSRIGSMVVVCNLMLYNSRTYVCVCTEMQLITVWTATVNLTLLSTLGVFFVQ